MKKSRSITLSLVGSALLASGCGESRQAPPPVRTFFDHAGNPVPRAQWKKPDGTPSELFDANGNPVSPDVVNQTFASSTGSSTTTHYRPYGYSSGWFWALGGPSYSNPRSSYGGPSVGRGSGSSGSSSSGSVSRGGFGSTGHAMGGSSSS